MAARNEQRIVPAEDHSVDIVVVPLPGLFALQIIRRPKIDLVIICSCSQPLAIMAESNIADRIARLDQFGN